jgi:protein involved in polysaccharide export with SLBB domain
VQLSELIVMSGGITDKASGEINIFRPAHVSCIGHNQNQVKSQFIKVKLSDLLSGKIDSNPQVRAGDVVTIEEAAPVYVTGGIAAPQRILFRAGMTLSRVVASAGGLSRNADQTRITIYRRQKDRSDLEIVEANLDKIFDQKADDTLLQAYDIIEVAETGRVRSLHPPIINTPESTKFDINKLPMRLVD